MLERFQRLGFGKGSDTTGTGGRYRVRGSGGGAIGGLFTATTLPEMLRTICIALPSKPCLLADESNPCVGTRAGGVAGTGI